MANRQLLHKNKLDDFKNWLILDNWENQETKSCYEMLRMVKNKKILIVYSKDDIKEHYTLQEKDIHLFYKWKRGLTK